MILVPYEVLEVERFDAPGDVLVLRQVDICGVESAIDTCIGIVRRITAKMNSTFRTSYDMSSATLSLRMEGERHSSLVFDTSCSDKSSLDNYSCRTTEVGTHIICIGDTKPLLCV